MLVSMETYLRQGKRRVQRLVMDPRVRTGGSALLYSSGGFLLSAASLLGYPQPIVMGALCALSGWRALLMTLGAMAGFPVFWGMAGAQGVVWAVTGGTLGLLLGQREENRDQPLMLPAMASFLTAVAGLAFWAVVKDTTPVPMLILRTGLSFFATMLFTQAAACRDAMTDWLTGSVVVLALAQVVPVPWLGLGYVAGGFASVAGAFPGAALAGLGLDLARVSPVPMTAVLCMAYFVQLIPFSKRWQHYAAPGAAYGVVMILCGIRDPTPLPGLLLGGALGALAPPQGKPRHRRGETGTAQVRLELGAAVMDSAQGLLAEMDMPPIDEEALLQKALERSCGSCSVRRTCSQRGSMTREVLFSPLDADCRKPGRLVPELHRAQEQLKALQAERYRQREYRSALLQQYRFLSAYLRGMADRLAHRPEEGALQFRVEASARSRGKERANGDHCVAFPGPGASYYLLLCDGMGTGLGAAQEGTNACRLLRQMLTAGFPPEHALGSFNSLLALRGSAGAVTIDLARLRLDTGIVHIYKWGAAPSWVMTRKGAEKIGTATPPPGISVTGIRETVEKLSLRRGEVLILLSDGVDGEDVLSRSGLTPDMPPGELAAKILEMGGRSEDDATAAVIRLQPTSLNLS